MRRGLLTIGVRFFSSARVGVVGLGERAQSVVARLAAQGETFRAVALSDDSRQAQGELPMPVVMLEPAMREEDHTKAIEVQLSVDGQMGDDRSLSTQLAQQASCDVVFVISDLGETMPNGVSPRLCRYFSDQGILTLSVALLPFSFGGHVLNERARRALRRLKMDSDAVFVVDAATLRSQDLHTANFYELHESFLDGIAQNISSLCAPLFRASDLRKITLMNWRQVFRRDEQGRGQEARLVSVRTNGAPVSGDAPGDRGKALVQSALTDRFFPVNDISDT